MIFYRSSPNILSTRVNEEAVLLDPEAGKYYGLNTVAAEVWEQLEQPRSHEDLSVAIASCFQVEREEAEQDIGNLLEDFHRKGLIQREEQIHS